MNNKDPMKNALVVFLPTILSLKSLHSSLMKPLLLLLLLSAALTATAQDDVIFTRYSHFDGLPASFSNSRMLVDQSGLLWIYTEQGYVRYDGYNFKIYP